MSAAMKKASRDYVIQFGGAMAASAVVLIVSITVIQHTNLPAPARALVSVSPVIPTVFA